MHACTCCVIQADSCAIFLITAFLSSPFCVCLSVFFVFCFVLRSSFVVYVLIRFFCSNFQIISAESLPPHMTVEQLTQMQLQPNMTIPADFSMPPPNTIPWRYVNQPFPVAQMEVKNEFIS